MLICYKTVPLQIELMHAFRCYFFFLPIEVSLIPFLIFNCISKRKVCTIPDLDDNSIRFEISP